MPLPSFFAIWFCFTGAINQEGARQWAEVSARAAMLNVALDLSPVRPAPVRDAENVFGHPWLKAALLPNAPVREAESEWRKAEGRAFIQAGRLLWNGQPDSFSAAYAVLQKEAPGHFPLGSPEPGLATGNAILTFLNQPGIPWDDLLTTLPRQFSQLPALGAFPNPDDVTPAELQDVNHLSFLGYHAGWRVAAHLAAGDPGRAVPFLQFQVRLFEAWSQHPTLMRLLIATSHFSAIINQTRLGFTLNSWREEDLMWLENWGRSIDFTKALRAAMVAEVGFSLAMVDHLYQDPALLDQITGGLHRALFAAGRTMQQALPGASIHGLPDAPEPETFKTEDLIKTLPSGVVELYKADLVRSWLERAFPLIDRQGLRGLMTAEKLPTPLQKVAAGFLAHEARVTLLRTACALQRYHKRHAAWPASLTMLVPAFLPAVPVDPCSEKPLVYETGIGGGGCRMYSFGQNLKDDTHDLSPQKPPAGGDDIFWFLPD